MPNENWQGNRCLLNPRGSDLDVVQGLDGVTASPTLLGPVLVWSQQNYLNLLLTMRYSKFFYGSCPTTFLRGEAGIKMNEMNIYISSFTGV